MAARGRRGAEAPAPTTSRRVRVAVRLRGLSLVCFVVYAIAQVGSAVAGWLEFVSQEQQHGSTPRVFGTEGYAWTLFEQTLQNWQSEFLALALLIALSSVLLHRGSKHSRDGSDEAKARIQAIDERIDRISAGRRVARAV